MSEFWTAFGQALLILAATALFVVWVICTMVGVAGAIHRPEGSRYARFWRFMAHSDRAVGCGWLRHPGGAGGGDPMSPALVRPMTRPTTTHSPRSDGGFSMPKEAK